MMHKKKNKLELHYLCIYGLDSVSQKLLAVEGLIYCDHALSDFELDLQFWSAFLLKFILKINPILYTFYNKGFP